MWERNEGATTALPQYPTISSVLRLPSRTVAGVRGLRPRQPGSRRGWSSANGVPDIEQALGYDLDERIVWALDTQGRLVGVDLQSGAWRAYLGGVERVAVGPDGTVFVVDTAGQLHPAHPALTAQAGPALRHPAHRASRGDQRTGPRRHHRQHSRRTTDFRRAGGSTRPGAGKGPSPRRWGELAASGQDDDVLLLRTSDGATLSTVDLPGPAIALAFESLGHRLYGLVGDAVVVIDRFSGDRIATIDLDRQGRDAARSERPLEVWCGRAAPIRCGCWTSPRRGV